MIQVTRLNGAEFYLNPETIQSVEQTPDTIITLLDNKKLVVKESPEVIVGRFIEYQRQIHCQGFEVEPARVISSAEDSWIK